MRHTSKKAWGAVGVDGGFTLLEVMISLAILAGVVFTVLTSLTYHMGVVARGQDTVTASLLGREKAEEAALLGLPGKEAGVFAAPVEKFSWRLNTAETELPGLKRVDVIVEWEGKDGVSFVSYHEK
jgi:general secretion pathway protein I